MAQANAHRFLSLKRENSIDLKCHLLLGVTLFAFVIGVIAATVVLHQALERTRVHAVTRLAPL